MARNVPPSSLPLRRGAVLIIVLAVLLILAMLATVFATFQTVERETAKNVTDDVRSKMLAQSGVEFAANELTRLTREGGFFQNDNSGAYSSAALDRTWLYFGAQPLEDQPQMLSTPLEDAANPSFALEVDDNPSNGPPNPAANPKLYTLVGGQQRGASAFVQSGTYAVNGDIFALKISDESGRININDGVEWGATHSVSKNLERMLTALGNTLNPVVANLGTTILNNRPVGGYKDRTELRTILGQSVFDRVKDHVTAVSWKDHNVANPVPLSSSVLGSYPAFASAPPPGGYIRPAGPLYRYGHQVDQRDKPLGVPLLWYDPGSSTPMHNGIYEHDSMNPQWIEVVARSPVNVNAASREVLVALVADLWGFFDSIERRRDRPVSAPGSSSYAWMSSVATYDQGGTAPTGGSDGDECGFIYTTMKYVDATTTAITASTLSAQVIVDEIMACRAGVTSCSTIHAANGTTVPGGMAHAAINYSAAGGLPFAGGFRTWAQFNAFVDYLVMDGVIREQRNAWFFDYFQNGGQKSGGSWIQMRMASQAAADVLKANFNPNLNLNEANPNHELFTHVDKTDLICNSTEFCFVPTNGAFQIESLGRVLRPTDGNDIFAAGIQNEIMAEKKVVAITHLWDCYRMTNQRDFYDGPAPLVVDSDYTTAPGPGAGKKKTDPALAVNLPAGSDAVGGTQGNSMTQSGPEPDNGPIGINSGFDNCIFSGYLQLSTYGGSYHGAGAKTKNQYATTLPTVWGPGIAAVPYGPATGSGERMHAHYDVDAALHWHRDSMGDVFGTPIVGIPLGGWLLFAYGQYNEITHTPYGNSPNGMNLFGTIGRVTTCANWKDIPEPYSGPYTPVDYTVNGHPTEWYRFCRGFRVPPGGSSFSFTMNSYAPLDLRIDGLYCERGSSVGYFTSDTEAMFQSTTATTIDKSSWRMREGTACFWMKPNWYPECTGKPRALLSMSRYRYHIHTSTHTQGPFLYYNLYAGYNEPPDTYTTVDCNHPLASYNNMAFDMTPFTLYYLPAQLHDSGASPTVGYDDGTSSLSYVGGIGKFRPACFGMGMGMGKTGGGDWDIQLPVYGWGNYTGGNTSYMANLHAACVTAPLSHEGHGASSIYAPPYTAAPDVFDPIKGEDGGFNRLRGHEWIHVIAAWKLPAPGAGPSDSVTPANFEIYVNGVPFSTPKTHTYGDPGSPRARQTLWFLDPVLITDGIDTFWGANSIRIGGETDGKPFGVGCDHDADGKVDPAGVNYNFSTLCAVQSPLPRMFTADATFDEFYVWNNRDLTAGGGLNYAVNTLWDQGRYYRPDDAGAGDGIYTSKAINLIPPPPAIRSLPPSSSVASPPGGGTPSTLSLPAAGSSPALKILGVSWTCYAEAYNPPSVTANAMVGYMRDWGATPPTNLIPSNAADVNGFKASTVVEMRISVNDGTSWVLGPYRNDGFSATNDPVTGTPIVATDYGGAFPTKIKFRAKFRVGTGGTLATLLSSPVLDDVTLYYQVGDPGYFSYMIETIR